MLHTVCLTCSLHHCRVLSRVSREKERIHTTQCKAKSKTGKRGFFYSLLHLHIACKTRLACACASHVHASCVHSCIRHAICRSFLHEFDDFLMVAWSRDGQRCIVAQETSWVDPPRASMFDVWKLSQNNLFDYKFVLFFMNLMTKM